jgi:hypothetical protein
MGDVRTHLGELGAVLADAMERGAPIVRAISDGLREPNGADTAVPAKPEANKRARRATPRPTVPFSDLDSAKADRALRRAGYLEPNE